ncbi:MAG: hypothetical protein IT467_08450 [Dokdonella sp.]|uniref:hypothetical protein n=1 Tax=Dokdonella sp. TaxID=2291710 RepID=UPI0025B808D6|nr:hypothetical protein [Dokdonella sp.]MBZ0223015.1 hypothetical protein [Dokdonella sp.]MCC7255947.1 hypothetical protein [Dokdonella sp.]
MSMMPRSFLPLVLAAGLFGAAIPAMARVADQPWQSSVDSAAFAKQAKEVRDEMQPAGRYGDIGAADRSEVETNLATMQKLFDARGMVSKMNNAEQVELANAQEKINALLTSNDGDRKICTLEQRSGTHFKTKVCMTARERAEVTRGSQEAYRNELMKGGASQAKGN